MEKYLAETTMLNYSSSSIQDLIHTRKWHDMDQYEKIESIYDFVQNEILFGYNCSDLLTAKQVLSDRYGQCNTKVFIVSRIPRLLAILCTGAGMSTAGLLMQKLCRNKFVSPTTGATIASAQFGILITLIFIPDAVLLEKTLIAFVSALVGTGIYVAFMQRVQFKDIVLVPLVGIMFGNIIGGVTEFLAFKYEVNQALATWLVGHFSLVLKGRYEIVYLTVPLLIIAFIFANHFNIAGMGKDFSKNLGVPYNLVLFLGLAIASMITASIVVVVGTVSYIGLIIPNIVTEFKGEQIRGIFIDNALLGALFVLVCDMIGRTIINPYELPIELIVGIAGGVMFLVFLVYKLRNGGKVQHRKGDRA